MNHSLITCARVSVKLDKKNIHQALDASLKRLQTDYIDLYQTHWPDRDTNYFGRLDYYHAPEKDGTAIAETLDVLDGLVKAGKIRMIGISNETPWGCSEYLRVANELNLPRIVSIQNPYNLLNRSFEIGLSEFAHREQTGLLAYSPARLWCFEWQIFKRCSTGRHTIGVVGSFQSLHQPASGCGDGRTMSNWHKKTDWTQRKWLWPLSTAAPF